MNIEQLNFERVIKHRKQRQRKIWWLKNIYPNMKQPKVSVKIEKSESIWQRFVNFIKKIFGI